MQTDPAMIKSPVAIIKARFQSNPKRCVYPNIFYSWENSYYPNGS
jgi:hypothetical protein